MECGGLTPLLWVPAWSNGRRRYSSELSGAGAEALEFAVGTIGVAGHAAAPAVPDEEVAPEGPGVLGDLFDEVFFDFDRVFLLGQAEALAEAGDVGVDNDAGFDAVSVAEDDIGGFASDTREMGEGFESAGDFAFVVVDEGLGGGADVFRFVAEEAGGADEVFEVFLLGGGHAFGIGVFLEEGGGHQVDAHVGALRGEDGGDEELEGAVVVEFAVGVGVGGAEDAKKLAGASVARFFGGAGLGGRGTRLACPF